MKKMTILFMLMTAMTLLSGCSQVKDVVAEESPLIQVDNAYNDFAQIYTREYQDYVKNQLNGLVENSGEIDLFENPIVVGNPYSTNTTGLYVRFTTEEPTKISYTISTEGYEDFSGTLFDGEEDYNTNHEYMVVGCVPDIENTVSLTATDEKGDKLGSYTFTYQAPPLLNEDTDIQATIKKGESKEPLSDGFYTILGNDLSEDETDADYVGIYDNDGVIRCEIPIVSFRAHEMIFDEQGMYYSVSSRLLACMDRTGYVGRIYDMGDYTLHHDYYFGSQDDIIVLASKRNAGSKDDRIISVNLESGDVTEIVDLNKLFPDYVSTLTLPENTKILDWMHLNSLSMIDEDSFVVSARETSTIIVLDDVYTEPKVRYMIGSDNFWAGTGYEDLLLTREGEFSLQGGQHSVLYVEDESLEEGQYYLMMYNNNNTYSLQRKEYDWLADDNYYDTGVANDSRGNPSYYYKYLVDENARSFQLVDSIPVGYSGFVSSVQQSGDNLVIDSGGCFTTYEFDKDGQLIQELTYGGEKWIYRVKKYEFKGYWFD